MKKIFKLSILILTVMLIILMLCNVIKNLIIINNINARTDEIFSSENLYIKVETKQNSEKNIVNEIYCKDNIVLINTYENNVLQTKNWKDISNGKIKSYIYLSDKIVENDSFNDDLLKSVEENAKLKKSLFHLGKKVENYYMFSENKIFDKYYNKDSYTLEKINDIENSIEVVYTFSSNVVTDLDITMPEENTNSK